MLFSATSKQVPLNRYPLWKYLLIVISIALAVIYALPMLYGESSAIQLNSKAGLSLDSASLEAVQTSLKSAGLNFTQASLVGGEVQVIFPDSTAQLKAFGLLQKTFGQTETVAMNLLPNTPNFLRLLGAAPMKLGLDLRGGMYFLLDVDTPAVLDSSLQSYTEELQEGFRSNDIRYTDLSEAAQKIEIHLRSPRFVPLAKDYVHSNFPNLTEFPSKDPLSLSFGLSPQASAQIESYAVDQTVNVMRNRVNELGVAEASVAKQGLNRVVIELPGLQDAARAKEIIGGTSTLKVMLVNESADIQDALHGHLPLGSILYYTPSGQAFVLYDRVIITGKSVVGATAGFDSQMGQPIVNVLLSGPDVSRFSEVTADNVGHLMAIVLVNQSFTQETDQIISVANIQQALGNRFQITGLHAQEAQNLAMNIRAGALPAPVQIVEEKRIGPSLGAENVRLGAISVALAMGIVMLFVVMYYHLLGFFADLALLLNLIFIIAIMSILPGATLTLPGIAGIVLNVGMAIDSNVLIFERIREELRNGTTVQAAIHAGYTRAFATIFDSNVTTLIVAVILFAIGSGTIKGFAVTLMIGIVTSMFTSLVVTRGLVNLTYGGRLVKWISIGIRPPKTGAQ